MSGKKWYFLASRDGDSRDHKRTTVRLKLTPFLHDEPVLMSYPYLETASFVVKVTPEAKTMLKKMDEKWAKAILLDHCIGWLENHVSET